MYIYMTVSCLLKYKYKISLKICKSISFTNCVQSTCIHILLFDLSNYRNSLPVLLDLILKCYMDQDQVVRLHTSKVR